MSDELKHCPHCGNRDSLMVTRVEGETVLPDNFQVVCSWLSGGCGASGGARRTETEAIATWNARAEELEPGSNLLEPKRCELEETESYECRRFDAADPRLYATRLTVHVLECSECGRTCEHVNGTYPRCPYCSAVNVLDENYESANDGLAAESVVIMPTADGNDGTVALADSGTVEDETSQAPESDSRERLEADVYRAAEEMDRFYCGEKFIDTRMIIGWLDRQEAITAREVKERVNFSLITQTANALFPDYQARVAELEEQVDSLTTELRECDENRIEFKAQRDFLQQRVDGLTAELERKQRVCDVQRESFRKIEAECKQLADENECFRKHGTPFYGGWLDGNREWGLR